MEEWAELAAGVLVQKMLQKLIEVVLIMRDMLQKI